MSEMLGAGDRRRGAAARRGIVLAVVLAAMVLILLLLVALTKRVVIEQRAIDSRAQALQADWLLWSAQNRAKSAKIGENGAPADWKMAFGEGERETDRENLGKTIVARFLPQEPQGVAKTTAPMKPIQIELVWTLSSGATLERSQRILLPPPASKDAP